MYSFSCWLSIQGRRCQCPKMQPSFMRCANRSSLHCRCIGFKNWIFPCYIAYKYIFIYKLYFSHVCIKPFVCYNSNQVMLYLTYRKILSKVNVWLLLELTKKTCVLHNVSFGRPRFQIVHQRKGPKNILGPIRSRRFRVRYQLRQVSKLQERSQLVSTGRAAPREIGQAGARRSGVLFLIVWS